MASPDKNVLQMNHYSDRVDVQERLVQHGGELLNIARNAIAQAETGAGSNQGGVSMPPYSPIDPLSASNAEVRAAIAALQGDAAPVFQPVQVPTPAVPGNDSVDSLSNDQVPLNSVHSTITHGPPLLSNQGPLVHNMEDVPVTPSMPVTIQRRQRANGTSKRPRQFLLPPSADASDTDTSLSSGQNLRRRQRDNIPPGWFAAPQPPVPGWNANGDLAAAFPPSPGPFTVPAVAAPYQEKLRPTDFKPPTPLTPAPSVMSYSPPVAVPYAPPPPYHPPFAPSTSSTLYQPTIAPFYPIGTGQPLIAPSFAMTQPSVTLAMGQPSVAPTIGQPPVLHYAPPTPYPYMTTMPVAGTIMQPYPSPPQVHSWDAFQQWSNWQAHLMATGQMQPKGQTQWQ